VELALQFESLRNALLFSVNMPSLELHEALEQWLQHCSYLDLSSAQNLTEIVPLIGSHRIFNYDSY
jgi:hypothetical protein